MYKKQIRYIDPRGRETIIGPDPPYIFEKITGTGAEDAQLMSTAPAGQDGKSLHGLYLGDREVTVYTHIKGQSIADMFEQRKALLAQLSPTSSRDGTLGRLEYTNNIGTWWIPALCKKGPRDITRKRTYATSNQIVFYCPSPYWRDMAPERVIMAYQGGGLEFPLEIDSVNKIEFGTKGYAATLYNKGDHPAPFLIDIYGPSLEPRITKTATGEYIRVNRQLEAGDVLHIDTTPGHRDVSITHADGSTESAYGYLDLTSSFYQLDPGANRLIYQSEEDNEETVIILSVYGYYGGI